MKLSLQQQHDTSTEDEQTKPGHSAAATNRTHLMTNKPFNNLQI